jgi:hypothetical protein
LDAIGNFGMLALTICGAESNTKQGGHDVSQSGYRQVICVGGGAMSIHLTVYLVDWPILNREFASLDLYPEVLSLLDGKCDWAEEFDDSEWDSNWRAGEAIIAYYDGVRPRMLTELRKTADQALRPIFYCPRVDDLFPGTKVPPYAMAVDPASVLRLVSRWLALDLKMFCSCEPPAQGSYLPTAERMMRYLRSWERLLKAGAATGKGILGVPS